MSLFTWTEKSVIWVWKRKWIVLTVTSTTVFIAATPYIWPGGWGIGSGRSIIKTIEKDAQGNIVKETEVISPNSGKSLWDGLSLLGVPLSLALLGAWFQHSQQKQADEDVKEETLQIYFDRISSLLLDRNLIAIINKSEDNSSENQEVLDAALDNIQARTLSILRQFEHDTERKSSVIRFLAETEIISKLKLNLSGVNLSGVNLEGINLEGAILERANLECAKLSWSIFEGAKLFGCSFCGSDLYAANLAKTTLYWSNFAGTNLASATLSEAILYGAKLEKTNLSKANLSGAKLSGANLSGANLSGANLSGAKFSTFGLSGAMPSSSKFVETFRNWEKLSKTNRISFVLYSGSSSIENSFVGANFEWVELYGRTSKFTEVYTATLSEAILKKADLNDVKFDEDTIWPGKSEIIKAKGIPDELRQRFGLFGSRQEQSSNQRPNEVIEKVKEDIFVAQSGIGQPNVIDELIDQKAFNLIHVHDAIQEVAKVGVKQTVKVGILSTGFSSSISELNEHIDISVGKSFVDGEELSQDESGYGTGLAVIVAAIAPKAKIIPLKVIGSQGSGMDGQILAGMNSAIANECQIIVFTFGAPLRNSQSPSSIYTTMIQRARRSNILPVIAGQGGAEQQTHPANVPGMFVVAATDDQDRIASFANYGTWVSLAAPGTNIKTVGEGSKLQEVNHASNSAAVVAGVAALVLSIRPDLSIDQLETILKDSAVAITAQSPHLKGKLGAGRIDALAAVLRAKDSMNP